MRPCALPWALIGRSIVVEREQKKAPAPKRAETNEEVVEPTSASSDKLKGDIDDLLDEIDEVLETNAEDFVKSYIQKGGE